MRLMYRALSSPSQANMAATHWLYLSRCLSRLEPTSPQKRHLAERDGSVNFTTNQKSAQRAQRSYHFKNNVVSRQNLKCSYITILNKDWIHFKHDTFYIDRNKTQAVFNFNMTRKTLKFELNTTYQNCFLEICTLLFHSVFLTLIFIRC